MKYLIWGTGKHCDDRLFCYPQILEETVCFIDARGGVIQEWYGRRVIVQEEIQNYAFDKIVIAAVQKYDEIKRLCMEQHGIGEDRIVSIDRLITQKLIDGEWEPGEVILEASTLCQLDCVQCYMRKGNNLSYNAGYLRFSDFKKLIDENPFIRSVELSNNGEIFLNPELDQIIAYAYEKNVRLTAWNGVNFNTVSDGMLEDLVKYGFRELFIALDGASQETYKIYRRKGDFDKVIENIRKLNAYKEKYGSPYPRLTWQFVIMPSTENDIAAAKEMDCISRKEYDAKNELMYNTSCLQLFTRPAINWDGRFVGCCCPAYDLYPDSENVFEKGFLPVYHSDNVNFAKGLVTGRQKDEGEKRVPCQTCRFWPTMKKKNAYIVPADLF